MCPRGRFAEPRHRRPFPRCTGRVCGGDPPGDIRGIPDGLAMYRVDTVDRVSLFAARDKPNRPSAGLAPLGAASPAGCPGVFR